MRIEVTVGVRIALLGGFSVEVDGEQVPRASWSRRPAAHLVQLLALTPGHRLHREQVMDALWPDADVASAAPRLHKAAHYARRGLGSPDSVVLHDDLVELWPGADLAVDAETFEHAATDALSLGDPDACGGAAELYAGDLLPEELYEEWAEEPRERLRTLRLDLLRAARRWAAVVDADPADEDAHLHLAVDALRAGDAAAALRQFERLERALRRELGAAPGPRALALREKALAMFRGSAVGPAKDPDLVGREQELARLDRLLDAVQRGRGQVLFVSGPPGIGKSATLVRLERGAAARGMRVGTGLAARTAADWPYAPVLEALSAVCRHHPGLLDGLPDPLRDEIERAMSGRQQQWDGAGGHQRLYVAAVELLRLAGAGNGAVLTIDEADEADVASLRLLHQLARATAGEKVLIAVAHGSAPPPALAQMRAALLARDQATTLDLRPLSRAASLTLVRQHVDDPALADALVETGDGVPFALVETARAAARGESDPWRAILEPRGVPATVLDTLACAAVLGTEFDTDELAAVAGLDDDGVSAAVRAGVAHGLLVRTATGLAFRHALLRDRLRARLDGPAYRAVQLRAARAIEATGGSPARVAHHLIEAGRAEQAVPWALRAAETRAALGAYRDALALLDRVRAAATGQDRAKLLALRAALLSAAGHPDAVDAHREALAHATDPAAVRELRTNLSKAAMVGGDLETAALALEGLEVDGRDQRADAELLIARAHVHLFSGELDAARQDAELAKRRILLAPGSPTAAFDLVAFEALLAHYDGEFFHRLHAELRRGAERPQLVTGIFDSHLCVAEYVLYGPTPYEEVIALADSLRESAERSGVRRAAAFAATLGGEAALLQGNLEAAERRLTEAVELHHGIGSLVGESHSLQRLAEVRMLTGDRAAARRLLARSLPLARWSHMARCLLPPIYGTQIELAAGDSQVAVAEEAVAAMGADDHCFFCSIMLDLPAARAYADAGDLPAARRHLEAAELSAARWHSIGWDAAVLEARAHLVAAEGDRAAAAGLRARAADMFTLAGQERDARRLRHGAAGEPRIA
ncbi:AAA family ATPase [Georgenia sp. EYE_87]|uniref:ATP-binding protein n=1 Tax=Georgenia sp. EYE_87 TaxID=2853448 RepID=UPI00200397E8|nr:AAA family ATPase [Georgenia sp. EYE_87]MCK6210717.1 AAA family ATPase [Georgenia sp. EYE_87]